MYTKVFPCLNLHRDRALARTMWTSLSKFPERIFPSCHELSFRYSMNCLNWSFSRFNRESIVYFSNYRRFFPGLHVLPIKTIVTTISLDILFFSFVSRFVSQLIDTNFYPYSIFRTVDFRIIMKICSKDWIFVLETERKKEKENARWNYIAYESHFTFDHLKMSVDEVVMEHLAAREN